MCRGKYIKRSCVFELHSAESSLCRCSCLRPPPSALFQRWHASEKQSEVSFHYAQQHNPRLCNSLLKSLLLVFPWS